MPTLSLERVLRDLHDSRINAGLQTFYDDGMQVWISDQMNSRRAETSISRKVVPAAELPVLIHYRMREVHGQEEHDARSSRRG